MNIGVHVSIRKGYLEAARTAHRIGARAFQYFPKNPRSLALKQLDVRDASAAAQYCRQHGIVSVAHAPYPTNPAVDDPMRREKVARSLLNDLMIAEACGSLGVVVHFGYSSAADPLQGYKNVLLCLNDVLARWNGRARILLENEAGGHGPMGTRLEEMVQIRRLSDRPERIGFCFDTCHAFQSGEWPDALDTFATWEKRARESGYFRHVEVIRRERLRLSVCFAAGSPCQYRTRADGCAYARPIFAYAGHRSCCIYIRDARFQGGRSRAGNARSRQSCVSRNIKAVISRCLLSLSAIKPKLAKTKRLRRFGGDAPERTMVDCF